MKRASLILCLIVWTTSLWANDNTKTYKNEKLGYEFSYPASWLLEVDEKSDYVSLLSPGAKKPDSLDLAGGIKVEFIREIDAQTFQQEIASEKYTPCGSSNEGKRITYCSETEDIIFLATGLSQDKTFIAARGYLLKKEPKKEYLQQYLLVIGSFAFTAE